MRIRSIGVGIAVGSLLILPAHGSSEVTRSTAVSAVKGPGLGFSTAVANSQADGSVRIRWTSSAKAVTVTLLQHPSDATGQTLGHGSGSDHIAVHNLQAAPPWYFRLKATDGMAVVITTRTLGLTGAPNARDMGGYRTSNGGWVRVGLLYRSPQLCGLPSDQVDSINRLGIHTILDLRSDVELEHCPMPEGMRGTVNHIGFIPEGDPILTLDNAQTLEEYRAAFDKQGGPRGNNRAWQTSVALPHSVTAVRKAFAAITDADGAPVLINCSAGQDRTGWVAYTMLRVLGVAPRIAMKDYMLSAKYNAEEYPPAIEFFESLGYSPAESAAGVVVSPARVRTTLQAINLVYGSFDRYVELGLGLDAAEIAQLRSVYVAK